VLSSRWQHEKPRNLASKKCGRQRDAPKGNPDDRLSAIADYTAAIELPGAPAEQVVKALVNRGVTKAQQGDKRGAIEHVHAF
jgi:hypothetical protein